MVADRAGLGQEMTHDVNTNVAFKWNQVRDRTLGREEARERPLSLIYHVGYLSNTRQVDSYFIHLVFSNIISSLVPRNASFNPIYNFRRHLPCGLQQ